VDSKIATGIDQCALYAVAPEDGNGCVNRHAFGYTAKIQSNSGGERHGSGRPFQADPPPAAAGARPEASLAVASGALSREW
jgi:hypothetical protein